MPTNNTAATETTVRDERYQKVIAKARAVARDTLRIRNIHSLIREKAEIDLTVSEHKKAVEDQVKEAELNVERVTFRIGKVEDTDPDREEVLKKLNLMLEDAKHALNYALADRDNVAAAAARKEEEKKLLDEKIAKWETGENKVQLTNINDLARDYVELAMNEQAINDILAVS